MTLSRRWLSFAALSAASGLTAFIGLSLALDQRAPAAVTPEQGPAVVELFQSQGCSSCPPAAAVVNALADRPDVLALSFEVTYWDQLGWKDTFSKPAYTERQWDYADAAGRRNVYTPQVIVNGRVALVGNVKGQVEQAIAVTERTGTAPRITASKSTVEIGAGMNGRATVWLVRYDPRIIQVPVNAGENAGRTLPHRNVVRDLAKLGNWSGRAQTYNLPRGAPGLAGAVLVQDGAGGPILAAARI